MSVLLYAFLSAAFYYLLSTAQLTQFLWSRYSPRFDRFMSCSACLGFWTGASAACLFQMDFLGLSGHAWYTPIVVGLVSITTTPIMADLQISALKRISGG